MKKSKENPEVHPLRDSRKRIEIKSLRRNPLAYDPTETQ